MTRRESTISLGNGRTISATSADNNCNGQTIDGIQEEDDVFEDRTPKHLKWNLSNELLAILDTTCHDIDRYEYAVFVPCLPFIQLQDSSTE